jgi:hypothetical protein
MTLCRAWLLLICAFATSGSAQQVFEGYTTVSGNGFAFEIKAPRGWMIDTEAGKSQGLNLVLYPRGADWANSDAICYVRVRSLEALVRNIEEQVDDTLRNQRNQGSPSAQARYIKTLTTQDASKAKIYHFTGDKFGNYEAAAYIQAKNMIHFMTLSARNESAFKANLPAFDALVTSYQDLTKPPTIDPEPANDRGL